MRKTLSLCALLLVFSSAAFALHPLIGKWKFKEIIGGVAFYDYVTITSVSTTTRKVSGYITGLTSYKISGYYYGNIVYLEDASADYYIDGYYFTFQGTVPFKKHLGICSIYSDFDATWNALATAKLSSSTTVTEIRNPGEYLLQKSLKKQAQIKESMTARAVIE